MSSDSKVSLPFTSKIAGYSTTSCSSPPESSPLYSRDARPTFQRSGIGGAGNYHKKSSCLQPLPRTSDTLRSSTGASHFSTGIGGRGNIRGSGERRTKTYEDELLQSAIERTGGRTRGSFFGIGGAGNRALRGTVIGVVEINGDGQSDASRRPLMRKLAALMSWNKLKESRPRGREFRWH